MVVIVLLQFASVWDGIYFSWRSKRLVQWSSFSRSSGSIWSGWRLSLGFSRKARRAPAKAKMKKNADFVVAMALHARFLRKCAGCLVKPAEVSLSSSQARCSLRQRLIAGFNKYGLGTSLIMFDLDSFVRDDTTQLRFQSEFTGLLLCPGKSWEMIRATCNLPGAQEWKDRSWKSWGRIFGVVAVRSNGSRLRVQFFWTRHEIGLRVSCAMFVI